MVRLFLATLAAFLMFFRAAVLCLDGLMPSGRVVELTCLLLLVIDPHFI